MDISLKKLEKLMPFPNWRILNLIGSGTFGSVFRIQSNSGDVCALKVIPVPYTPEDMREALLNAGNNPAQARKSFDSVIKQVLDREIGTAEKCASCPNVFRIFEKTVVDDPENAVQRYVMVRMELLMDLKSHLTRREATQEDVLRMMQDVANALAFMEGKNIIHRDIKPANIMMDGRGHCKLTDFGEARVMQGGSQTIARGTPYYMAPEVYTGHHYDHRADIYSLGIVAYYFLNSCQYPLVDRGYRPREAWNERMRGAECPPLNNVSAQINRVLLKCIAYRPENRYSSAADLLRDLDKLRGQGRIPIAGGRGGRVEPTPNPRGGDDPWNDRRNRDRSYDRDSDRRQSGYNSDPNRGGNSGGQGEVVQQGDGKKHLSTGALVGIILGSVFGGLLLITLIIVAAANGL